MWTTEGGGRDRTGTTPTRLPDGSAELLRGGKPPVPEPGRFKNDSGEVNG